MKFLEVFYMKDPTREELIEKFESLSERYFEALKYYCPDCKRGFDRPIGKKTHDRLKHGR